MRVLFAGAGGVLGRQAVPMLAAAGYDVVALARHRNVVSHVETVVADALDREALTTAVRRVAPDVVVHMLTAIPDPLRPKRLARDMAATNRLRVEATGNLLEAAKDARLIAQSLAYAYDPRYGGVKDEDAPLWRTPPRQFRPVVAAVADMERQVTAAGGVVLRLGHLYGPGSSYDRYGGFAEQVAAGKAPLVGHGGAVFSFVHARDVASAILAAVDRTVLGVFNVVDDDPAPVREWLPVLAGLLGAPEPRTVPPWVARLAAGEWGVAFLTALVGASNARAREELGWEPAYPSWRDGFTAELT